MSKEFESTVVKQPTETDGGVELHARTPDPVYIVTDFGNHLSPAECDAAINNIYRSRGFLHGTTPSVHDIESFDFIDGAFQLRQLSITHDLPLHPYDAERATVSHKPGVFGAVVDPGVGTNRRVVVVDTEEGDRFVVPDNGVGYPALSRKTIKSAFAVHDEVFESIADTFHGRDLILKLVARISCGDKPEEMGEFLHQIDPQTLIKREFTDNMVVHVDGYGDKRGRSDYGGNVKFERIGLPVDQHGNEPTGATLTLPRRVWHREGLLPRYSRSVQVQTGHTIAAVPHGKPVIYTGSSGEESWNGNGHVELAVNGGSGRRSAAGRFKLYLGDEVGFAWQYPKGTSSRRVGSPVRR